MSSLIVAHGRRRRKTMLLLLLLTAAILLRGHIQVAFNILIRGPFIAHELSDHLKISQEKDGFDITFKSYSAQPAAFINTSLPVPPIIHHILLGNPRTNANLTVAHDACIKMHPGYEFKHWDDESARQFVAKEYPTLFEMWSSYQYTIQKADTLRYMVLYAYGGIFLDLDLECRRPLDPLRRFDFVAPAATPMGISNGFLMVSPKHPFMKYVMSNLSRYNINWFGLPYTIVMFSTGCHFLSTMQALFPNRSSLRILWGPNHLHQLSGAVVTPLFRHFGASSWHEADGTLITNFKLGHVLSKITSALFTRLVVVLAVVMACLALYRRRLRKRQRKSRWGWEQKSLKDLSV